MTIYLPGEQFEAIATALRHAHDADGNRILILPDEMPLPKPEIHSWVNYYGAKVSLHVAALPRIRLGDVTILWRTPS